MKSSVKLQFCRRDLLVAAVIAAAAVILAAILWGGAASADSGGLVAVIGTDGSETDRVVLSSLTRAEERSYSGRGYTLTVRFSPDGVRVEQSDCPGQDCVHTGEITRAGQSIVCLPARISIQLERQGGHADGDVDAVIG